MTRSSISSSGVPTSNVSCVGRRSGPRRDVVGQIALAERVAARQDDGALDDVLQLADVARPRVVHEAVERAARRLQARPAVLRAVEAEEVVDEERNVLAPSAQGRRGDRDDVEAVEEVLAEAPRADLARRDRGWSRPRCARRPSACCRRAARRRGGGGALSRGPLLPAQRHRDHGATLAGSARRHPAARRPFSRPLLRQERPAAPSPTRGALEQIDSWPGNVRELENVIERAVVLSRNETLDETDLPDHIAAASPSVATPLTFEIGTTLDEIELRVIRETLRHTKGDKSLAAQLLGISTRTIYRKLDGVTSDPALQECRHSLSQGSSGRDGPRQPGESGPGSPGKDAATSDVCDMARASQMERGPLCRTRSGPSQPPP